MCNVYSDYTACVLESIVHSAWVNIIILIIIYYYHTNTNTTNTNDSLIATITISSSSTTIIYHDPNPQPNCLSPPPSISQQNTIRLDNDKQ